MNAPIGLEADGPTVNVDAFCLDRFEVTAERYRTCVDAGECARPATREAGCNFEDPARAQHPMNCLTHGQAQVFCVTQRMRLPTEAQWEAAATLRGAAPAPKVGSEEQVGLLTGTATAPVGSRTGATSPDGVSDLFGNVAEWVRDWYAPYDAVERKNPTGPTRGSEHVLRGGAFTGVSALLGGPPVPVSRVATFRASLPPEAASIAVGFRCAAELE